MKLEELQKKLNAVQEEFQKLEQQKERIAVRQNQLQGQYALLVEQIGKSQKPKKGKKSEGTS